MKVSEILRKLADVVAAAETDQSNQPTLQSISNTNSVEPKTDQVSSITMLSPLQQDLELKKKSLGIDNAFDDQKFDQSQNDELELIKKSAGVIAITGRPN